ncbi:hypothetical protein, partial [Frigoribacterium sp. UYMn621]|uniref:hypothetical protein n=1 Tax=Frigoribacterium sp. UYMn621 TaxID=3156343 RepID=UPI003393127A
AAHINVVAVIPASTLARTIPAVPRGLMSIWLTRDLSRTTFGYRVSHWSGAATAPRHGIVQLIDRELGQGYYIQMQGDAPVAVLSERRVALWQLRWSSRSRI